MHSIERHRPPEQLGLTYVCDNAGRITSVDNSLGSTTATYDEAGRITEKSVTGQSIDDTSAYCYEAARMITTSMDIIAGATKRGGRLRRRSSSVQTPYHGG
ncbi:MAG: hypothetical protein KJ993_07915 [Actinobacteria bacterium]|nr:hypothetical protein [Actinomycetota bacterium]MBU1942567.1 hypothetical protein [Actinomycetota bacterium]